jgi:hypothetical protein
MFLESWAISPPSLSPPWLSIQSSTSEHHWRAKMPTNMQNGAPVVSSITPHIQIRNSLFHPCESKWAKRLEVREGAPRNWGPYVVVHPTPTNRPSWQSTSKKRHTIGRALLYIPWATTSRLPYERWIESWCLGRTRLHGSSKSSQAYSCSSSKLEIWSS